MGWVGTDSCRGPEIPRQDQVDHPFIDKAMSEIQVIEGVLQRTARRRRWQQAWKGLWHGLLVGSCVWLVVLVCYKLFPIPVVVLEGAAAAAALSVLVGFLSGWRHRLSLLATARWIDDRRKLQERLSTALEMAA